jgi:small redox-active disulfide protein 2
MINIKILGTGCPKCSKLEDLTKQAVTEIGIKANIEKISDITRIISYGVMTTPALIVNNQIKLTGRTSSLDELKKILKETTRI